MTAVLEKSVTVGEHPTECQHTDMDIRERVSLQGDNFVLSVGPITCRACGEVFMFATGKGKYSATASIPFGSNWSQRQAKKENTNHTDQGPGTEMLRLTEELGVESKPGCSCKSTARTMDKLGVDGCRDRINELVLTVESNWDSWGWKEKVMAVSKASWKAVGLGINPTDPLRCLLELAINRAETKH